jgi:hypothetical protein
MPRGLPSRRVASQGATDFAGGANHALVGSVFENADELLAELQNSVPIMLGGGPKQSFNFIELRVDHRRHGSIVYEQFGVKPGQRA